MFAVGDEWVVSRSDERSGEEAQGAIRRRDFICSTTLGAFSPRMPTVKAPPSTTDVVGEELYTSVEALEESTERSGYSLYTTNPAEFIPAQITRFAAAQRLLLTCRTLSAQRRLYRIIAHNAGFIAIRMIDIADSVDTFDWFRMAEQAAQQAEDVFVAAWVAGHWSDACVCYGRSLGRALKSARTAQEMGGAGANPAATFGFLVEAGIHARLGRRRETLEAVHRADLMFDLIPDEAAIEDGVRVPEYFLRWHQSNALTAIGEKEWADRLRRRTLELPFATKDLVGRALLDLDEASLLLGAGELDRACHAITMMWESLPREFRVGQVPRRIAEILHGLRPAEAATRDVGMLREYLRATTDQV
jgi:hypothetical protein